MSKSKKKKKNKNKSKKNINVQNNIKNISVNQKSDSSNKTVSVKKTANISTGNSDTKNQHKSYIPALIFYPLAIVFFELSLKLLDGYNSPWNSSLAVTVCFSLAAGLLLALIFTVIRPVILSRILSGITLLLIWLVFCVEYDCNQFYKMYYGLTYAISMTGQVMGDFSAVVWEVAREYALIEAFFFIPVLVFIIFSCKILPKRKFPVKLLPVILIPLLVLQLGTSLYERTGADKNIYTYDFTVFNAVPRIGLLNSFRLELAYMLTGTPMAPIEDDEFVLWSEDSSNQVAANTSNNSNTATGDSNENDNTKKNENNNNSNSTGSNSSDSADSNKSSDSADDSNSTASHSDNTDSLDSTDKKNSSPSDDINANTSDENNEEPKVYDYNALIDFAPLIENENNQTIKKMHQYFGSLEPSMQNEYTGYFEGKNLIYITAEAFCPYAIDKDFTPTLYMLANNGFVFENYYQPYWSLSTTGGEFANLTGVIPEWIESGNSFTVSANRYMPYSLAGLFKDKGYICKAYHNNSYTFYDRDKTHPNLGYDYKGIGNGLKLASDNWPNSDLEMMEATVPEMIEDYLNTGIPFHTYYMSVSGHCNYNWGGNAMSKKNKEAAVEAFPDSSTTVQAYMACNLELENAMKYLIDELDKAGILDDTVIVLTADHYPYAMSEGSIDYYVELSGIEDTPKSITRYENTLILYCSSMEENVYVDTPCSSIDIVPTLDNLFAVPYDSRLYSGRDIFAKNYEADKVSSSMPLVILPIGNRYSFLTAAGSYDCVTKEFTPNEGIEVDDNYVKDVLNMISNKWTYAKLIITNDYYSKVLPKETD